MKLKILPAAFLFGLMSWASGQVTEGDWTYVVENGGATITASTATGRVTIPSVLGGYAVKKVEDDVRGSIFGYGNASVTSVVIPNSVTSINGAFANCTGLTSVSIPNSVTNIGDCAFWGCTGLTSVSIPNSLTSIGESAFDGCTGLTSVSIPDSVTSIVGGVFWGCPNLKEVKIPLRFAYELGQIFELEVATLLRTQLQEEANLPWWKRILRIFQP